MTTLNRTVAAVSICAMAASSCGGRAELRSNGEGANNPNKPNDPPPPSDDFRIIAAPSLLDPRVVLSKLAVRSGEFDLAGRLEPEDGPDALWVGRLAWGATLSTTNPTVVRNNFPGPPGVGVRGDELILCGAPYSGDPTQVITLSGTFNEVGAFTIAGNSAGCQGAVFVGQRGLMAVHRPPDVGCCSRSVLYDFDNIGAAPVEALPESEFGYINLITLGNEFVWSGLIDEDRIAQVTFSPDGVTRRSYAYEVPEGQFWRAPDLAGNTGLSAVLASVLHANGTSTLMALSATGDILFERAFESNSVEGLPRPRRVNVATTSTGWLAAWSECNDSTDGRIMVERIDATGAGQQLTIPITCFSGISDVAVSGNRAVVTWSSDEGLFGVGLQLPL